jgi:phosphate starvation-inducible membrane PsiE
MEKNPSRLDRFGRLLVDGFEAFALFVIGATVVWAGAREYLDIIADGRVGLDDILLLFIYLELGAMVGIYFKTNRLPVLFLLYVAITALTRFLVIEIKDLAVDNVLVITGSILILVLAALALQFATSRFDTPREPKVTEH